MYTRNDKIFVRVNRNGFIPQLGISGPIPNPVKVTCGICLDMVSAGIDVYQVDPSTRKMVKLTVDNVFDDKKFVTKKKTPVATSPAVQSAAVSEPAVQPIQFSGVKKEEAATTQGTPVENTSDPDVKSEEKKAPEEKNATSTKDESMQTSSNKKNHNNNKKK